MITWTILLIICIILILIGISGLFIPSPVKSNNITKFSEKAPPLANIKNYPQCTKNPLKCFTDQDCNICKEQVEGEEMSCLQVNPSNPNSDKYCALKSSLEQVSNCNTENGAVLSWTGWSGVEDGSWECICQYPNYTSGEACENLIPGICSNGTFIWNASMGPPEVGICKCDTGYSRYTETATGIPRCLPSQTAFMYEDTMTNSGYRYIGCYTDRSVFTSTQEFQIKGKKYSDVLSKIQNYPHEFFAITYNASTNTTILLLFFGITSFQGYSNDPRCSGTFSDDNSLKCGTLDTNAKQIFWTVYKKN